MRLSQPTTGSTFAANVLIETAEGERVVAIEQLRFASADRSTTAWARNGDDLYTLNWMPASNQPSGQRVSPRGDWIVFADNGGTADAIAVEIDAAGGNCHLVRVGMACAQVAQRCWVIDPANPGHYRWLFEELGCAGTTFRGGVIHGWSLDIARGGQTEPGRLEQDDVICTGSLLHLLQCLASHAPAGTCPTYVLTRGAQDVTGTEAVAALQPRAAALWGLAGVAAIEHPELRIRMIDLDPSEDAASGRRLLAELLDRRDARIALRGHERWVPRLQPHTPAARRPPRGRDDRAVRLELVRPDSFDGLELRPLDHIAPQPHEVRLRVLSAGINFRDVLTVLQMHPGPLPPLGVECAGIVTEVGGAVGALRVGDRVFGFAPASLGSEAVVPAAFLARIPDGMRSEDAAGIAVAFLTAYYGFHHLAGLRRGERVLVHAAAGGVGLAAVQLAQRCGAEVFVTAGSEAKRDLLHRLGVTHVMDSRSVAFADQVLVETGGKGVDVVLNALSGEFIPAGLRSWRRVAAFSNSASAASGRPRQSQKSGRMSAIIPTTWALWRSPTTPCCNHVRGDPGGAGRRFVAPVAGTVFPLARRPMRCVTWPRPGTSAKSWCRRLPMTDPVDLTGFRYRQPRPTGSPAALARWVWKRRIG